MKEFTHINEKVMNRYHYQPSDLKKRGLSATRYLGQEEFSEFII